MPGVQKQFIEVPLPLSSGLVRKLWVRVKGALLAPPYLLAGSVVGLAGADFHVRCAIAGLRLLLARRASIKVCYSLMFFPMDSTRYFEFYEVWNSIKNLTFARYLDVSSPRLLPLFALRRSTGAVAKMINPDASDLTETERLATALGVSDRCDFYNGILDSAAAAPASFDLITCLSVLEHIPEDVAALKVMWSLLGPGGTLILTLPCRAQPLEQYISHNQYGVLGPGGDGYTFWQRYYDRQRLESSVYGVTGSPKRIAVYGEIKAGYFFRNANAKRLLGAQYPFWREPFMMASEYREFASIDELPGEGVVILEFVKPIPVG